MLLIVIYGVKMGIILWDGICCVVCTMGRHTNLSIYIQWDGMCRHLKDSLVGTGNHAISLDPFNGDKNRFPHLHGKRILYISTPLFLSITKLPPPPSSFSRPRTPQSTC